MWIPLNTKLFNKASKPNGLTNLDFNQTTVECCPSLFLPLIFVSGRSCLNFLLHLKIINIPKDEFQDYDITYFVSDIEPFISNDDWLNQFGNIIMMQKPEDVDYSHLKKRDFPILCYLMITIKLILPYCPWKS